MSGVYQPLIIGFGVISSVLCVWIAIKLDILSPKGLADEFKPISLLKYLCWLVVEIAKADWAVSKLIISPKPTIRQRLLLIPSTQQTDLGKTLFANSITITPGTVTVETEADNFIVHALTDEAADKEVLAEMGDRVSALEKNTVQA